MERIFHGSWTLGPLHCYPFTLIGRGSHTVLHSHAHDHVLGASRPIAVYVVHQNGEQEIVPEPSGGRYLVCAHAEHLIFALEDGGTDCACMFSRYDENGEFLEDPKEASRQPYREPCDPANVPPLVLEYLARDHGVSPVDL